ncbi:MAG: GNAT family N-acetyltransferase [Lachnospiraceae bacterium]|nr:GNAT family N-acetyltransferase [Lachnospiraceae bacterium]
MSKKLHPMCRYMQFPVTLVLDKSDICISMLVVDDLFKHKGVGGFALQFAEKFASEHSKEAIRIQTTKDNTIAKKFYLKYSYDIIREMVYQVGDGVDREGYEFIKHIQPKALVPAISKMLGKTINLADYQTKQLQGGTLGDVRFVTGMAETVDGDKLPYKIVWKKQEKWERPGDPDSWRREYDLYQSNLGATFTPALRWPECYHSELQDGNIELWIEYIDGVSGSDLTIEMLEQAALELGRFQGRNIKQHDKLRNISCLGDTGFLEREFSQWHTQSFTYDFLISEPCHIPGFLKEMLKNGDIQLIDGKSFEYSCLRSRSCDIPENLKQMIMDIDDRKDELFDKLKNLPIVLCHRDFWNENIFFTDGVIRLIDWDTAGWGVLGEDIASLIVDGMDIEQFEENYRRLVPAYLKGLSEYMVVPAVEEMYTLEMILIKFGYRIIQEYIFSETADEKFWSLNALQKIYEMNNAKEIIQ